MGGVDGDASVYGSRDHRGGIGKSIEPDLLATSGSHWFQGGGGGFRNLVALDADVLATRVRHFESESVAGLAEC